LFVEVIMAANGFHHDETLQWRVGLMNSMNKYLTAETFGFKINASSMSMRKKQFWVIEHDEREDDTVYIKSHLGRYLTADKKGNVECSEETRGESGKFTIKYQQDGSGKWAFQNKFNKYFFGGTEDNLRCYEKNPTATEYWTIRLDIHPQVNIKSVARKKYGRLNKETQQILFDELIPWGEDALINLEFSEGKYAIRSYEGRYLKNDGSLVDSCSADTLYKLELRSGQFSGMALKDNTGSYLTAVGRDATMQSRAKNQKQDETFTLEDSHPQVFIMAHNGKMVSSKQGVDLTANQDERSDKETFQIEFDKRSNGWRMRTCDNKYWSLEAASGIQAIGNDKSGTGVFTIEYLDGGVVAIKASNGKYLTARMNGSLYAVSDAVSDKERFIITIINRPILVLKCEFGFVGLKSANNNRVECNKVSYNQIFLEHTDGKSGEYYLKGSNGKYWSVDGEGMINADSATPHPFLCEMRAQSRFAIKAPNGKYIKGEQNGIFCANQSELSKATMWEY
jgi:fascin 1/2